MSSPAASIARFCWAGLLVGISMLVRGSVDIVAALRLHGMRGPAAAGAGFAT